MALEILTKRDAHEYVMECVKAVDGEIGGIGYVELTEPGKFYISRFVLLEQEAGTASVDFESDAYIEEITRAANRGRENLLRVSWHSHGKMSTYFSATDERGIKEYKALGMPWLVSLVFNQNGEIDTRVDIFGHEIIDQITMSDVDYYIEANQSRIAQRARADVKRLVKPAKYTTSYVGQSGSWREDQKKREEEAKKKNDKDDDAFGDKGNNIFDGSDDDVDLSKYSANELFGDIQSEEDWIELEHHFGKEVVDRWREEDKRLKRESETTILN